MAKGSNDIETARSEVRTPLRTINPLDGLTYSDRHSNITVSKKDIERLAKLYNFFCDEIKKDLPEDPEEGEGIAMQFSSDSIALIRSGLKTQTRRPWKEGDSIVLFANENCIWVIRRGGKDLWVVGHTYAIQSGSGKKADGRIRLTGIRLQTLGEIDDFEAELEGIRPYGTDLRLWCYGNTILEAPTAAAAYLVLWKSMYGHAEPNEKVWAISFKMEKKQL